MRPKDITVMHIHAMTCWMVLLRCCLTLQVCHIIRQAYSRVELPIIMLIPQDTHNSATQACIEAGANDWIVEPFGLAELLARLNTHIMLPQLVAAEADRYSNYALLQEMLPHRIIERLKTGSKVIAEQHEQVRACVLRVGGYVVGWVSG